MARKNLPPAVREAAERLIGFISNDDVLANHVAEGLIDSRVAAGKLIPVEKLQLGPGLTLAPAGRIPELEAAVAAAIQALDGDKPRVDEALVALHKVTAPELPEPEGAVAADPDAAETEVDDPLIEAEAPKREIPVRRGPKPADVPVEPSGRPVGMPDSAVEHPCDECGQSVEGKHASLTWTRFRRVLCVDCLE